MKNLPPLRWLVPLVLVLAFGAYRVSILMASSEDKIERRITFLLDGLEEREPRRISRGFMSFYRDEDTGYTKENVQDAVRAVMVPGQRYRGTLDPVDGLVFVSGPESGPDHEQATIDLHFLVEVRFGAGDDYDPYWDVRAQADLEHRDGRWWIVATRDVNWNEMPR